MNSKSTLTLICILLALNLNAQNPCLVDFNVDVFQTSLGSPVEGPFAPDEEVLIGLTLYWNGLDCNWLHGLVPTFGSGWSPSSFDANGTPEILDPLNNGVGNFNWYNMGEVFYKATNSQEYSYGDPLPAGWYITGTTAGINTSCSINQYYFDPNCSCGISQDCNNVVFHQMVIKLKTRSIEECADGLSDLSVSFKIFSDIESGAGINEYCIDVPPINESWEIDCNPRLDLELTAQDLNIYNNGTVEIDFTDFVTEVNPEVSYKWVVENDAEIVGASSCIENCGNILYQELSNTDLYEVKQVHYHVTAIRPDGIQGLPAKFSVNVYPNLTLTTSYDDSNVICSGVTPVTLESEAYGGAVLDDSIAAYQYLWNNGETTESITVMPEMTTTYELIITDQLGTSSSTLLTVNVEELPMATILPEAFEVPCEGLSPDFLSFSTDTDQYEITWSGPGITPTNQSDPTIYPSDEGDFNLQITDMTTGCSNSFSTAVQKINPIALEIAASEMNTCQSLNPSVLLTAAVPNGVWSENVDANGYFTPNETGLQTITYTYTDEVTNCTFAESLQIDVFDAELPELAWENETLTQYCIGHEYIFCVDPNEEASRFYWESENAILTTENLAPNCVAITWYETVETPSICTRYETEDGCLGPELCNADIQLVEESNCALVSNQNLNASNDINIFPNPSSDNLTIEAKQLNTIQIISSHGKMLFSKELAAVDIFEVDLANFSNGMYYVLINNHVIKKMVVLK